MKALVIPHLPISMVFCVSHVFVGYKYITSDRYLFFDCHSYTQTNKGKRVCGFLQVMRWKKRNRKFTITFSGASFILIATNHNAERQTLFCALFFLFTYVRSPLPLAQSAIVLSYCKLDICLNFTMHEMELGSISLWQKTSISKLAKTLLCSSTGKIGTQSDTKRHLFSLLSHKGGKGAARKVKPNQSICLHFAFR